jgi:hypothetical protein
MLAGGTISLSRRTTDTFGNLAKALGDQIGMSNIDRSIDEPDVQFGAAAGALHQSGELDQR